MRFKSFILQTSIAFFHPIAIPDPLATAIRLFKVNMATKYVTVHEGPNGAGDARPTGLQIVRDEELEGKWAGRVILITGCSSGIGLETAKALFATGATLYLTARNIPKARDALGDIASSDRVHLLKLDLESLNSVRTAATAFSSMSKTLNVFIANAGVMACPEGCTKDGFELHLGTNHLSHFLLFNLLKPILLSSSTPEFNSRAIFVTSAAHHYSEVNFDNINLHGTYDSNIAYAQSKTANLWTSNEIARRYGSRGLHAWAVNPGFVQSEIGRHLSPEQNEYFQTSFASEFKTAEQGASSSVWAATAKVLEGKGGKYLEECEYSTPWKEENGPFGFGYTPWAYDAEKEGKLWEISSKLVGIADEK